MAHREHKLSHIFVIYTNSKTMLQKHILSDSQNRHAKVDE